MVYNISLCRNFFALAGTYYFLKMEATFCEEGKVDEQIALFIAEFFCSVSDGRINPLVRR